MKKYAIATIVVVILIAGIWRSRMTDETPQSNPITQAAPVVSSEPAATNPPNLGLSPQQIAIVKYCRHWAERLLQLRTDARASKLLAVLQQCRAPDELADLKMTPAGVQGIPESNLLLLPYRQKDGGQEHPAFFQIESRTIFIHAEIVRGDDPLLAGEVLAHELSHVLDAQEMYLLPESGPGRRVMSEFRAQREGWLCLQQLSGGNFSSALTAVGLEADRLNLTDIRQTPKTLLERLDKAFPAEWVSGPDPYVRLQLFTTFIPAMPVFSTSGTEEFALLNNYVCYFMLQHLSVPGLDQQTSMQVVLLVSTWSKVAALWKQGKRAEAIEQADRLASIDPQFASYSQTRAYALIAMAHNKRASGQPLNLDELEEAAQHVKRLERDEPFCFGTYWNKILLADVEDRTEEADRIVTEAKKLFPHQQMWPKFEQLRLDRRSAYAKPRPQ